MTFCLPVQSPGKSEKQSLCAARRSNASLNPISCRRDATQQLNGAPGPAREIDPSIRDLRSLLWCLIDNDCSRDLDQLTVAERLSTGAIKILVAIADVDAIVKPASPLDRHAQTNTLPVQLFASTEVACPIEVSDQIDSTRCHRSAANS